VLSHRQTATHRGPELKKLRAFVFTTYLIAWGSVNFYAQPGVNKRNKMYSKLKKYCKQIVPLTERELNLIDAYFEPILIRKNAFLLNDGAICNFIAYISEGAIRHFHVKNGIEKTCDISFENSWVTDFQSFTYNTSSVMNLQALENTVVFIIKKQNLGLQILLCSKRHCKCRLAGTLFKNFLS
jgi:hypothetical protein